MEIKNCPFCGGEAEVFVDRWFNSNPGYSGGQGKRIRCKECGALGKWVHVGYFNEFSKVSVDELKNNRSLRAKEDEAYDEYVKSKEKEAIEIWNTRNPSPTPTTPRKGEG